MRKYYSLAKNKNLQNSTYNTLSLNSGAFEIYVMIWTSPFVKHKGKNIKGIKKGMPDCKKSKKKSLTKIMNTYEFFNSLNLKLIYNYVAY